MNKSNIIKSSVVFLVASLIVVWLFFPLLRNINHVYFANGGDGAKDYYTMVYHIKYDSTYLHSGAMNYPYGDNIFFSGAQPFLTNAIKFISQNIVDISDYIIGIHNASLLAAIPITVVILYLIFQLLNLPFLLSFLMAIGIAFSSPQIDRMAGHFSLSYTFFIPLLLYLLMLFQQKKTYLLSTFISLMFVIVSFTHGYFFAFYAIIILLYWLFDWVKSKKSSKSDYGLFHFCIQFVIPVIVFQVITVWADGVTDRTSNPLGFLFYRAYPESVFISQGRYFWVYVNKIITIRQVEWEGVTYVGLIAAIGFIYLVVAMFKKLFKLNSSLLFNVTDNFILNIFFWSSFLLLLFSFGIPFIFKLEFLIDYLGPLRQFRSIGRFTWYFYYAINIVIMYKLWNWLKDKNIYFRIGFLLVILSVLLYDAWINCRAMPNYMNNQLTEFDNAVHVKNKNSRDYSEYQAIMPLPYFNGGSENISINAPSEIMLKSYFFSLKTGLPLNAVMMSRTSIGQCNNNIQLVKEPYRKYKVLDDLRSNKDLLLLVDKSNISPSDAVNILLNAASFKDTLNGFSLMTLPIEKLRALPEIKREQSLKDFESKLIINSSEYIYLNFDSLSASKSYLGRGSLKVDFSNYFSIYNGVFPSSDTLYVCSFWVYGAMEDIVPRATIEVGLMDSTKKYYNVEYKNLGNSLVVFDDKWALVEFQVKPSQINGQLSIILYPLRPNTEVYIDELIIRPFNKNVIREVKNGIVKDNRVYLKNVQ